MAKIENQDPGHCTWKIDPANQDWVRTNHCNVGFKCAVGGPSDRLTHEEFQKQRTTLKARGIKEKPVPDSDEILIDCVPDTE